MLAIVTIAGLIALPRVATAGRCTVKTCGRVRVHADVEQARVYVGRGPAVGYTPLTLDLPAGTHTVVVTKAPGRPVTLDVAVTAGATTKAFASLSKLSVDEVRTDRETCDDGDHDQDQEARRAAKGRQVDDA